jgi:hypothetical protein
MRSAVTSRKFGGSTQRGAVAASGAPVTGAGSFSSVVGFGMARSCASVIFEKNNAGQPPKHAAAPINATQQIASASQIVVTFNFRFGAHYGLKSDIAACPKKCQRRKLGIRGWGLYDATTKMRTPLN